MPQPTRLDYCRDYHLEKRRRIGNTGLFDSPCTSTSSSGNAKGVINGIGVVTCGFRPFLGD